MSGDPLPPGLIAAHYRITPDRPAASEVAGLPAFSVRDDHAPTRKLIALRIPMAAPPRARFIQRTDLAVPNAVMAVDAGPGRDLAGQSGWFIVSEAPPGQSLTAERHAWREHDLISCVLKPAAAALDALHLTGLTHRAIRPDNLFREGGRGPVTLGPCFASPPASKQPSVIEPPYSGWCMAAGRGDGSIADDVYALGATLLALALGRLPMAGMDDGAVVRRKLQLGSYAALVGDVPLPPLLADLLRVMLAEEPDHRPSPAALLNPEQARTRRVAARPPPRAQRPLDVGGMPVHSARELAYAIGVHAERGEQILRDGTVDRWLRRTLGDSQLAVRLQESIERRDTEQPALDVAMTVMRAVVALDPLAPLVWRGLTLMPQGLGAAASSVSVTAAVDALAAVEEIVAHGVVLTYAVLAARRPEHGPLKVESRQWHEWLSARNAAGGIRRVLYGLNPLLACQSPLLSEVPAATLGELLPALENAAAKTDRRRAPMDPHIASFLVARGDPTLTNELATLANFADDASRLIVLRLFAHLQERTHPKPLPGLAAWLNDSGFAGLQRWRSRTTREDMRAQLATAVTAGSIGAMLTLVSDENALELDNAGSFHAGHRIAAIKAALKQIDEGVGERAEAARRVGHEIATGLGLMATMGAALMLALG